MDGVALGAGYAGVSAYWGLGGTYLLSPVGGQLGQQATYGLVLTVVGLLVQADVVRFAGHGVGPSSTLPW